MTVELKVWRSPLPPAASEQLIVPIQAHASSRARAAFTRFLALEPDWCQPDPALVRSTGRARSCSTLRAA